MKKTYLYAIVVLVILVALISIWLFTGPVGAFSLKQFDFSLSRNPISGKITQGQSATSSIKATLVDGKTQTVQLSVSGCPASTSCSLNPTSGNPTFYSTLTILTSSTTPLGTYSITISGVGGGKTRTTAYTLTVNPIPCNCTSWTNGACGAGGCTNQRQQTRTCMPSGCNVESQCVDDANCLACSDGTFYGQCSVTKPLYCSSGTLINSCSQCGCPSGQSCNATTGSCYTPCNCSSWTNGLCGGDSCSLDQMQQTRTCMPSGCDVTSQCVINASCHLDSCSDTDGGFVTTVRGTVSGYKSNNPYNLTDTCPTNTTLIEYYCSGTNYLSSNVSCFMNTTTHCLNGACV